jgi:CrcB protein
MPRTSPLEQVETVLVVGVGGFAGANLRYFLELAVPSTLGATLTVNVLGCAALGFVLYEGVSGAALSPTSRTLLATGLLGSFTTYSTFVLDALTTTPVVAVGYVVASYGLGFAAVLAGREGARWATATTGQSAEVRD